MDRSLVNKMRNSIVHNHMLGALHQLNCVISTLSSIVLDIYSRYILPHRYKDSRGQVWSRYCWSNFCTFPHSRDVSESKRVEVLCQVFLVVQGKVCFLLSKARRVVIVSLSVVENIGLDLLKSKS